MKMVGLVFAASFYNLPTSQTICMYNLQKDLGEIKPWVQSLALILSPLIAIQIFQPIRKLKNQHSLYLCQNCIKVRAVYKHLTITMSTDHIIM